MDAGGNGPAILVVDDEASSVNLLRITLGMDYVVYTASDGASALAILERHPEVAIAIIDQRMPNMSGSELIKQTVERHPYLIRIILTGYTDMEALIEAVNAGNIYRYLTKPWNREELMMTVRQGLDLHRLAIENSRLQQELQVANQRLRVENSLLKREARGRYRFEEMVGSSPALRRTLELVERVVVSEATVLIHGETGTGKELIARAIHYNGPRAERPFVTENCGAIAPDLLTSELFGHRRGAFTGASDDRQGLFEMADGGTLFLDEIGDCPPELQTRLLRVLDQGEIRPVGENRAIPVDVRIIAATHHDLEADVQAGRFRKDLFYRLSVITVTPPPLRERLEDVPALAQHFLQRLIADTGKRVEGFSVEALAVLGSYDYPGNVRELANEVERAFTLSDPGTFITADLLSSKLAPVVSLPVAPPGSLHAQLDQLEAQLVREALARRGNNQTHAAADLHISRRSLIDKIQKHGLTR